MKGNDMSNNTILNWVAYTCCGLSVVVLVLLGITAVDMYEYSKTKECVDCWILQWLANM